MIKLSLTHAWLNLWDKHMTSGRINQFATHLWWYTKCNSLSGAPGGHLDQTSHSEHATEQVFLSKLFLKLSRASTRRQPRKTKAEKTQLESCKNWLRVFLSPTDKTGSLHETRLSYAKVRHLSNSSQSQNFKKQKTLVFEPSDAESNDTGLRPLSLSPFPYS